MPRGGPRNIKTHTCPDGQVRRVEPVYLRLESADAGKRIFQRMTWFCHICRYSDGDWEPTKVADKGK